MKRIAPFVVLLALLSAACNNAPSSPISPNAQKYEKETSPWPVTENSVALELPFLGGFNDPKPSLVDFNGDGLTDLMVGQIDGSLLYLQNSGTLFQPKWEMIQERLGGIDIGTWHTFCDIDGDGDLDLFCDSRNSQVSFYRNDSRGQRIFFTLIDPAFNDFATGINNTPTFADIDNDGDPDYFFGALSGRLEFHRNIGRANRPSFEFVTDAYDSILAFPFNPVRTSALNHGFSYINFADIDSDNDLDLVWGDIFNLNMYFFRNEGTPDSSSLRLVTQSYLPFITTGFNHGAFADLDNDDDLDMILGIGQVAELDNLRLLRNIGIPQLPMFIEESRNVVSQIDVGTGSVPATGDLDNDGDYDLLVGGANGQLTYYENVGTASNPSFERVTQSFAGIDVGSFSAPALVDWDDDGDFDLLIGNAAGRVEFWRNDGDVTNFVATLVTNQLAGIVVDQLAIPQPVDLNGDSLLDLVVGEWDFNGAANLWLYENTGTSSNPNLVLVTAKLLVIGQRDFALPVIYDWNGDNLPDVILAGRFSGLRLFANSAPSGQFPDSTTLIETSDVIPGHDAGQRVAVTFVDIDGDGDDDVFAGERSGGINFYRRVR